MRLVDLSVTIDAVPSERVPVAIRYTDHRTGAQEMSAVFGVPADQLPDAEGWAGEELTLITHAGTHMDAPWHYGTLSQGQPSRSIDRIPLEWCVGPGVVLDMRHKPDGASVQVSDLIESLDAIPHTLASGDIILLMTGAADHWGTAEYPDRGCGLDRDATLWLVRAGIRVIGTDGWSLDCPFPAMRREYARTGSTAAIWPAHFAGREREYCQLEKLTNLSVLPRIGFTVFCFPIKIARASAGWTRVVALLQTVGEESCR